MFPDAKIVLKRKIGQLLLEEGLINKEILNEALKYQEKYGGFLGSYLVKNGYVTEKDIVFCLSSQYGFPYINLSNSKIDEDVIALIPASLAEKYCLIPVDRIGGLITIAVADPLNFEALDAVRLITGQEIRVFIATISDIRDCLEQYYGILVREDMNTEIKTKTINTNSYYGKERRRYDRFKVSINIGFSYSEKFSKNQTVNIGTGGICFLSKNYIPVDSYLAIDIFLPRHARKKPILSVVKVVRIREIKIKDNYEIGVMFIQIDPAERTAMIKYAQDFQLKK